GEWRKFSRNYPFAANALKTAILRPRIWTGNERWAQLKLHFWKKKRAGGCPPARRYLKQALQLVADLDPMPNAANAGCGEIATRGRSRSSCYHRACRRRRILHRAVRHKAGWPLRPRAAQDGRGGHRRDDQRIGR